MIHFSKDNIRFFKGYDPTWQAPAAPRTPRAQVLSAKNGGLTLRFDHKFVHSKYNPTREAASLLKKQVNDPTPDHLHVHFGFGLGYLVEAAAQLEPPPARVFIFEPIEELLHQALTYRPLQPILEPLGALVRTNLGAFRELLAEQLGYQQEVVLVIHPFHGQTCAELLRDFQTMVLREIEQKKVERVTLEKGYPLVIKSTLRSLAASQRLPDVAALAPLLKDKPAVILAAGPSLERNIALLKPFRDRVVLFAVSRVMRVLQAFQLAPHFMVHTEAKDYSHFIKDVALLHSTTMLLSQQCHHAMFEAACLQRFSYQTGVNAVSRYLQQRLPDYKATAIGSGGSVANDAFSLAFALGCNPIILVGQDLAVKDGRYYAMPQLNRAFAHQASMFRQAPGYFGTPVQTLVHYRPFISWYQDALTHYQRQHPQARFINATEGGARLEGFETAKLAELLHHLKAEPHQLDAALNKPFISEGPSKATLANLLDDLKHLISRNSLDHLNFRQASTQIGRYLYHLRKHPFIDLKILEKLRALLERQRWVLADLEQQQPILWGLAALKVEEAARPFKDDQLASLSAAFSRMELAWRALDDGRDALLRMIAFLHECLDDENG